MFNFFKRKEKKLVQVQDESKQTRWLSEEQFADKMIEEQKMKTEQLRFGSAYPAEPFAMPCWIERRWLL
jgi:hypothetical protein